MVAITNTWFPAACPCVIEYQWEENDPNSVSFSRVVSRGTEHSGLSGQNLYNVLIDESKRVETILSYVLNNFSYMRQTLNEEGNNQVYILADDAQYLWSYDGLDSSRTLRVEFRGRTLNATDKITLQTAMNQQLGSGKVLVL